LLHFYKTPGILKKLSKDLIWDISTDKKEIFLTFDDGPIPILTEYVLETLADFGAKATFFCVGDNVLKYPDVIKKIIEKGHAVGNHTFNHLKGWSTKNDHLFINIEKCQSYINRYDTTTKRPLFRPPYGQITWSLLKVLKNKYDIIMWDVLVYDFEESHSPQISLSKSIHKTVSGSIVVFHDNYKAEKKLRYILPRFLQHFDDLGFTFKKLDLLQLS